MDLDVRNVLLAINIADDYFKTKKKAKDYRTESQEKDKTVLDMKHKIIDLQEQEKNNEKKMDELEKALEDAEKKMVEAGMTIVEPDVAPFKALVDPVYEKLGYAELREQLYKEIGKTN